MSKLMFPVYVAEQGKELPKEGTYYVVAANGILLHKDTGIVKALVEVDSIPALAKIQPQVNLRLPKFPPHIIYAAWKFFNAVYEKHHSESAVVVHFNQKEKDYYLHCPEQTVTHGSVNYSLDDRFEGYQLVGTIHSHCDFSAFHSGTDIDDEVDQDGVHVTLGHVNSQFFSTSACIVVNGHRFPTDLENCAFGVRRATIKDKNKSIVTGTESRYQVNLSDEEKASIDKAYDDEIKTWLAEKVRGPRNVSYRTGTNSGVSTYSKTTPTTGGTSLATFPSSTKNEEVYVYREDPNGSGRKGWFSDVGEELAAEEESTTTATVDPEMAIDADLVAPDEAQDVEEWDAEKVLAQHQELFSQENYEKEKGDGNTDDTVVE